MFLTFIKRAPVRLVHVLLFFSLVCAQHVLRAQDNYQQRRIDFYEYSIANSPKEGLTGIFGQLARLEMDLPLEEHVINGALRVIQSNTDCNDFSINGLLRLHYLMKDKRKQFNPDLQKEIRAHILDFKYWWNDPRRDTTYRCYHTENHQALYHTAELLAGQLYPDVKFTSGKTGLEHQAHAEELLTRWLEQKFRFGFSEWISTYYDVEILLLTNIIDFANDETLRVRASMLLDLLLYDVALHHFQGTIGASSGRAYTHSLITGHHDLSPIVELVFGSGYYVPRSVMGVSALATSSYQCPDFVLEVAQYDQPLYTKQRMGLRVEDAWQYGLDGCQEKDVHYFWGIQEFVHPLVVQSSKALSEKYDVWPHRDYQNYMTKYEKQIQENGKIVDSDLGLFALPEANVISYKTKNFMLSTAVDYRKGKRGYQHHIWQASLSNKAVVYTTHPGGKNMRSSPNYWAGNVLLPRAVQYKNIALIYYKIPENQATDFTHAYFPKHHFERFVEQDGWVFAEKEGSYIALYSRQATTWATNEAGEWTDLIARGRENVWICEVSDHDKEGSFSNFVSRVVKSKVLLEGDSIAFQSVYGMLNFSWNGDFTVNGLVQDLRFENRYANDFGEVVFGDDHYVFKGKESRLILDFKNGNRIVK